MSAGVRLLGDAAKATGAPAKAAMMSPRSEISRDLESPPTWSTSSAAQAAVIEAATPHARMYRVSNALGPRCMTRYRPKHPKRVTP